MRKSLFECGFGLVMMSKPCDCDLLASSVLPLPHWCWKTNKQSSLRSLKSVWIKWLPRATWRNSKCCLTWLSLFPRDTSVLSSLVASSLSSFLIKGFFREYSSIRAFDGARFPLCQKERIVIAYQHVISLCVNAHYFIQLQYRQRMNPSKESFNNVVVYVEISFRHRISLT